MNLILILILTLIYWLFGTTTIVDDEGRMESHSCAAEVGGVERCGPTTIDNGYQVPAAGNVIHAVVNNGPISPEYQAGYEIVVDAGGTVTITETPPGASGDLGEGQQTTEEIVRTEEIGEAGLQRLLAEFESCGLYYLPQSAEFDDVIPVGGSVSILEVRLDDGSWEVSGSVLEGTAATQFDACQSQLGEQFGVSAPE
jgi:hypothetical protein